MYVSRADCVGVRGAGTEFLAAIDPDGISFKRGRCKPLVCLLDLECRASRMVFISSARERHRLVRLYQQSHNSMQQSRKKDES